MVDWSKKARVVQRIEHWFPEPKMWVRFPPSAPAFYRKLRWQPAPYNAKHLCGVRICPGAHFDVLSSSCNFFSRPYNAIGMPERDSPKITFKDKGKPSFKQIQDEINQFHELRQKIDDHISVIEGSVELSVNFEGPVRVIPISDTHLFSAQTDTKKARELLEKLNEPNTYGIIMGDFIEGGHPKITDHAGSLELNTRQQIWAAREIIRPYVATGKILCLVGTFNGHEGWGERLMNYDLVQEIAHGFKQPDGTDLKVVYNGGRLMVHFANGVTYNQLLYHAPGGGGSDEVNPLGSQRQRLWEFVSHRGPIDGVGGGDWHHRAGVSKELSFDLRVGKERSHVLFANGTTKGNDPERPDPFLTRMGKGPTLSPGVQLVLNQPERVEGDKRNGEYVWASYGYDKGEVLYDAAKLWDKVEKQGKTQQLVSEIKERSVKPRAVFDRRNSSTKTKERRFDVPAFEKFRWKIERDTKIPVLIYLLANARYGSTSFEQRDREKLLEILKQVEGDPFKYALVMRHFIDSEISKKFERTDVLDRMTADLAGTVKKNRLLGLMLSSTLIADRWTRATFGEWEEEEYKGKKGEIKTRRTREVNEGFRPGDYLYEKLDRKVPLYLNHSLMQLDFGPVEYEFLLLDHLAHSGSEFDPFRGLVQARRKALLSSDIVAGGHMPNAGVMTTPDADYVSPGWFSDYDSRGKANMRRAPLGGQGVILFPDRKIVVPASTFLEATDLHTALTLNAGMKKEEKEKLLYKSKR
jgi:hypothetical protein